MARRSQYPLKAELARPAPLLVGTMDLLDPDYRAKRRARANSQSQEGDHQVAAEVVSHLNAHPPIRILGADGRRYVVLGHYDGSGEALLRYPFDFVDASDDNDRQYYIQPGVIGGTLESGSEAVPVIGGVPLTDKPMQTQPGWWWAGVGVHLNTVEVEPDVWEVQSAERVGDWIFGRLGTSTPPVGTVATFNPLTGASEDGEYYVFLGQVEEVGSGDARTWEFTQSRWGNWGAQFCLESLVFEEIAMPPRGGTVILQLAEEA